MSADNAVDHGRYPDLQFIKLSQSERRVAAVALREVAEALDEGAAGTIDYWFKRLAERLIDRARELNK
jgi:hypothetical protein